MSVLKKMIIVLAIFCIFAAVCHANETPATNVPAEEKITKDEEINWKAVTYNVLWYLPNRLIDLADCFTVELNAGDCGVDVYLTRYANIGAGVGNAYSAGWSHGRQYGFFNEPNYNANFLCFGKEARRRDNLLGSYKYFNYTNTSCMDIFMYPETLRHEDPYAIGAKASFLLGAKVQFHPIEFADFLAGFLLFDIKNDDRFENIYR